MPDSVQQYEIVIAGHLDARRWGEWFTGFTVETLADGATCLRGQVADQAALHGILACIRDLNLTLLAVTVVESPAPDVPGAGAADLLGERKDDR